jgi:hypothetical protein
VRCETGTLRTCGCAATRFQVAPLPTTGCASASSITPVGSTLELANHDSAGLSEPGLSTWALCLCQI